MNFSRFLGVRFLPRSPILFSDSGRYFTCSSNFVNPIGMDRETVKMDPRQQLAGMTQHEDDFVVETSRWEVVRVFRIHRHLGFRW